MGNIETLGRYALVVGVCQQIDSLQYTYEGNKHRATEVGASIATGSAIGGPWGAVGGAAVGGSFWAGEKLYDGVNWWEGERSKGITNIESALDRGWVPGK